MPFKKSYAFKDFFLGCGEWGLGNLFVEYNADKGYST